MADPNRSPFEGRLSTDSRECQQRSRRSQHAASNRMNYMRSASNHWDRMLVPWPGHLVPTHSSGMPTIPLVDGKSLRALAKIRDADGLLSRHFRGLKDGK